jgi:hypothetical protein
MLYHLGPAKAAQIACPVPSALRACARDSRPRTRPGGFIEKPNCKSTCPVPEQGSRAWHGEGGSAPARCWRHTPTAGHPGSGAAGGRRSPGPWPRTPAGPLRRASRRHNHRGYDASRVIGTTLPEKIAGHFPCQRSQNGARRGGCAGSLFQRTVDGARGRGAAGRAHGERSHVLRLLDPGHHLGRAARVWSRQSGACAPSCQDQSLSAGPRGRARRTRSSASS